MTLFTPPKATELTELFQQVRTTNYYSILLDDSNSAFGTGIKTGYHVPRDAVPDNPALNLLMWKQQDFPESSVSVYYLTPSDKTDEQAMEESLLHYETLVGQRPEVQQFNPWLDYFPHVSTDSLQSGFYHKLDSFQGHYGQYYTGGFLNYETVQDSMEHARYIIDTEF